MKKKVKEESLSFWKNFAQTHNSLILFNGSEVLDLTGFAKVHPGSEKSIFKFRLQNIENILFTVRPHKLPTLKILKKFVIGKVKAEGKEDQKKKNKKKVRFVEKVEMIQKKEKELEEKGWEKKNIESMETSANVSENSSARSSSESEFEKEWGEDVFSEQKVSIVIPHMQTRFFQKATMKASSLHQNIPG